MIKTVGIAGLGLIGGSMAKAVRQYTDCTLLGYDTDGAVLSRALDEGVVSAALTADRLAECDLVIVALYPQATTDYVTAHRDRFRRGGAVMDCGGVKGVVCTPLADVVKDAGVWFVGGHPMAGVERSGYGHSFPELFQGASLILTPYPGTPRECLDGIWELARRLGFGHLQLSTPEEHDHIIAYTSQLAHVVSCAYVGRYDQGGQAQRGDVDGAVPGEPGGPGPGDRHPGRGACGLRVHHPPGGPGAAEGYAQACPGDQGSNR